ncbi:MAG: trehalose-phosphatase [Dehalococcoidia bacterium]|nr:trehalose-phosphatase [Dehalococcoidia bacterium]
MRDIFDHLDAVEELLSRSPFGLITDVDGTISEIAPSPQEARVSPACREHLAALTGKVGLVAAISGRPVLEVREMVGIEGMVYIGNHGLERWQNGTVEFSPGAEDYAAKVLSALDELGNLFTLEGLTFENKGVALAIHYRLCPDRERARQTILDIVETSALANQFRTLEGKMVVELRPPLDVNKGTAVEDLVARYNLKSGIYMGDDTGDIDAFRVMHRKGFFSLCVIADETPDDVLRESDFSANGVSDVARFLKWFAGVAPVLRQ